MEPRLIAFVEYQGPWPRRALLAVTLLRASVILLMPWHDGVALRIVAKPLDDLEA